MRKLPPILLALSLAACTGGTAADERDGPVSSTDSSLTGCRGTASSSMPPDDVFYLTTFGGPSESQSMSCGASTRSGTWYYAASKSRFGCGAKIKIEARGHCVIAQVADYGPDVCVENAAGKPIIDASPLVARALFGERELGWSDRYRVSVSLASSSASLGACVSESSDPAPVVSAPIDPTPSQPQPTTPPLSGACYSHTLERYVDEGECVESGTSHKSYQCKAGLWYALDSSGEGPDGACTAYYPAQ